MILGFAQLKDSAWLRQSLREGRENQKISGKHLRGAGLRQSGPKYEEKDGNARCIYIWKQRRDGRQQKTGNRKQKHKKHEKHDRLTDLAAPLSRPACDSVLIALFLL